MQRIIPRLAWLSALASCLLLVPATAQRQEPALRRAPPQPVELAVKVRREGKTEIPLRIHGKANEPLKFLIRTPPVHGKLAEPRPTDREAAVAVYEPPADLTITTDRFFYAAQGVAGVSASVEVSITILDQPPQLTIPDVLEFPALRTGATSSKLLEITNSGGGLAAGEVIVEAPWRIEGKTGYRLGAGDIAIFKIFFAPTAGGDFENVARFTSDPAHSTTLRGTAESSVVANPTRVLLRHGVGDPVRTGTFSLTNQTDEPRTLQLTSDSRLQLPPQVTLPARGQIEVPIQTAASDVLSLETSILITATDLEFRVPVKAAPPGPIVRATQPAVAFGRLAAGAAASAPFELENIGGTPGEVTWAIAPPFRTAQNSVLLLPGEKRRFAVELESSKPGKFRAWLQCKSGAQTFDVPVEAEVASVARNPENSGPMTSGSSPAEAATPAPESPVVESPAPAVPFDWLVDTALPAGVKVTGITPTSAVLEWPASLSPATRFRVQARVFGFAPDRSLQVNWQEIPGLEIKAQGASYLATIPDLQPAQPWALRVLPVKADGEPGERLFAVDFFTPPKPAILPTLSPLRVLLVALFGLVSWQVVTRWRRRP